MKGGRAAGGLVPIEILVFHQVGRQMADDRWLMTLAHTRGGPTSVHECKPNNDVELPAVYPIRTIACPFRIISFHGDDPNII